MLVLPAAAGIAHMILAMAMSSPVGQRELDCDFSVWCFPSLMVYRGSIIYEDEASLLLVVAPRHPLPRSCSTLPPMRPFAEYNDNKLAYPGSNELGALLLRYFGVFPSMFDTFSPSKMKTLSDLLHLEPTQQSAIQSNLRRHQG